MEFLFSQICGLIVSVAAIASMQLKNIKWILACQLICNGIGALSYIMLGGISGCGIYIVALAQAVIYFVFRFKNKKINLCVHILFIFLYMLCSALSYKNPYDLISALAALTCALALTQQNPFLYRVFMMANGIVWMIYDFNVGAYTMIISHIATALSAGIGMVRIDLKNK